MKAVNQKYQQEVLRQVTDWAEKKEDIRAVILTSSLANPNATPDEFSDYDIILVARDIYAYKDDDAWLGEFGPVLAVYHDPVEIRYGHSRFIRVTQYENGLKIDFTLWSPELLAQVVSEPELPPYIDIGYRVLLDKDNLTAGMKLPTYAAFITKSPSEKDFQACIEHFFNLTGYVAKHLRRGHLMPLKFCLDYGLKIDYLRLMLEWKIGIENSWSVKSGMYGAGIEKYLPPGLNAELESTYAGAGEEENWEALFRTIALFHKVAVEVASSLGFTYPQGMHDRVLNYLNKVKNGELP